MAITATMAEAQNDYYKAMRAGKREGETLPNLDDILKEKNIVAVREVPLGLVQIPSELIVGTKTAGRSSAFSKGFKPLLKENTEFAYKWMALYKAHLNEGIREPIKAYEFMNKFYVEEGNKRVSVLKFFDAVSIPGNVTRIVPPRTEEKENKIYYEFMDFYALSRINYIWFTQLGSFAKLQRLVGKRPDEAWSDDDRLDFASAYNRFRAEYYQGAIPAWKPEIILEEMEWTGKKEIIQEDFTQEKKIVLAREDDLVYSCLDLNPKAVSQLQDETGLPSGSLLKSLYYLTAKDLAREVWQNYYIRTEKRWA